MPHIDISIEELPDGQPTRLEANGFGIVVIRMDDGVFGYEDVCPHAKWRLSAGEVIGGVLACPGHGWEFDVKTGGCITVPSYCLKTITVEPLDAAMVRVTWSDEPREARVHVKCAVE